MVTLPDFHSLELAILQANADFTKTDFTFVDQISDLDLPRGQTTIARLELDQYDLVLLKLNAINRAPEESEVLGIPWIRFYQRKPLRCHKAAPDLSTSFF